jgi:hypothetical protein
MTQLHVTHENKEHVTIRRLTTLWFVAVQAGGSTFADESSRELLTPDYYLGHPEEKQSGLFVCCCFVRTADWKCTLYVDLADKLQNTTLQYFCTSTSIASLYKRSFSFYSLLFVQELEGIFQAHFLQKLLDTVSDNRVLLLLLLSSSSSLLSRLCMVFTIIHLKQTMFIGYIGLQLFCIFSLCYMFCYFSSEICFVLLR